MNVNVSAVWKPNFTVDAFMGKVNEGAVAGVTNLANAIFETSQELVAVDTGELKASGAVEVNQSGNEVSAEVSYGTNHCVFVEFGTGIRGAASPGAGPGPYSTTWPGMPSQPFMRPAMDLYRDQATDIVAEPISEALK